MTVTVPPSADSAVVERVSPAELRSWLADAREIALLDVRELAEYATGHLLLAVPAPRSRLELAVPRLVPRRTTRVVVIDGGPAASGRLGVGAARLLLEAGYSFVRVLDGGTAAWEGAGFELFTGVNSLSKAFGEFVQDTYEPPEIDVHELRERLDRGDDVLVVDSRPLDEFGRVAIPGGINCPGGELVARIFDAVRDPEQEIVVNCAGRTRAILGAQVLIDAGLPNPIRILRDGTSAWEFAGYEPARGGRAQLAAPAPGTLAADRAIAAGARLRHRSGVRTVDHSGLAELVDDPHRTVFLIDVRDPLEYRAGHLPGSRSVPGGQLLQALDEHVGTQRAHLVLVDGPGEVRSSSAAAWLTQLGLDDVLVLVGAFDGQTLEAGPEPVPAPLDGAASIPLADVPTIAPERLAELLGAGDAVVVDLGPSTTYREGHVPGAAFVLRRDLWAVAEDLGPVHLVLTADDPRLALLAAAELLGSRPRTDAEVSVLDGGNVAWRRAGNELVAEPLDLRSPELDVYAPPFDLEERRTWYEAYVAWGRQAADQVARDGSITFRSLATESDGG